MAAAKALGLYWDGSVGNFSGPDLPQGYQIRTAQPGGSLILRPKDRDTDLFLLVTGRAPVYQVVGWIPGIEGKTPRFLKAPNGRPSAYFVPQEALYEIKYLPHFERRKKSG
jgi:hypothetical protein